MADTLLFRGGPTASVNVSTVQNREIVIDTETNQLVTGTGRKRTLMTEPNGDSTCSGDFNVVGNLASSKLSIGSNTTQLLNIQAADAGKAYLAAFVTGKGSSIFGRNDNGTEIQSLSDNSALRVINFALGTNPSNAAVTARLTTNGFMVGGTESAPSCQLFTDGRANFSGAILYNTTNTNVGVTAFGIKQNNAFTFRVYADGTTSFSNDVYFAGSSVFNADGSLYSAGRVTVAGGTAIETNGDARFNGDVTCKTVGKGVVLKSPNGTSFRVSVGDDGTLSTTAI
jgi:hypothetical protein